MSSFEKSLVVGIGIIGMLLFCFLGAIFGASVANDRAQSRQTAAANASQPVQISANQPAPTAVPTISAPSIDEISPNAANLYALTAYAEEIKPILEEGLTAAERDGQILEQGKESPAALCGGSQTAHPTLVADAAVMARLKTSLEQIDPPAETAVQIHKPLSDSLSLWAEALTNLNKSCETAVAAERDLLRLGASLQMGGAILNFHVASDNFWRLLITYGLEAAFPRP